MTERLAGDRSVDAQIADLVSVIIPVFNRPAALVEAVASVRRQSYPSWELVIVDDGSSDGTSRVADQLAAADSARMTVVHQENGGPGLAREVGRRQARGEFLQYLDSDDLLYSQKLELQVAALREHPECAVAYGWTRERFAGGALSAGPTKGSGQPVETMFPSFLRSRWWDTPNPLYRSAVCAEAGPWTDLRLEEDWEMDCRIAALGTRLVHVPQFVCEVRTVEGTRQSGGGVTDVARNRDRARAHALILAHARRAGIAQSAPEMAVFARELFLLARQCGRAGLARESRELLTLAMGASSVERASGWDFKIYGAAGRALGWSAAARLAAAAEYLRPLARALSARRFSRSAGSHLEG